MTATDGNWAGWNRGRAGGENYRGKLPMPEHAHPLVRRLVEEMNAQHTTITDLAKRAGLRRRTISQWKTDWNPSVPNLVACFNALGLDLVVAPLKERG